MTGLTGNILITGGSGTLGHAIVRTAEREGWDARFTIYSRSELRQAQMRARHPKVRYVLGDVRDAERTAAAIAGHDVVIHAAAMKRVDECERQPAECYATNVIGSMNVVRACVLHGVGRCVGVSTDKAVRAITAYGASKLCMESLFQAQPSRPTYFTLVRYGNVVASNGSVIPIWRDKAARGEPLPITDKRCTRFWMAPSAAVRLIVDATQTYYPGVIIVPRMGALSLVEMAGIIAPGAEFTETGLRSLEKIHEDLIHTDELVQENTVDAGQFWVRQPGGTLGHVYTSDHAPRLTRDQFLAMLSEAESYD